MKRRISFLIILVLLAAACGSGDGEDSPPSSAAESSPPSTLTEGDQIEGTAVPQPLSPAQQPATDKWALWTDGVHLRGVDMHPCLLYTEAGCTQAISRQDVQELRDLGANLINASYPGLFTETPPYEVNPTALAYLDDLIGWAEEVGFYVVIHFRTGPGRNEGAITGEGDPLFDVWRDQAAHDAWVEMWRFTADRYRNSPAVAGYDLMVEPHSNTLVDPDFELEPAQAQAQMTGTLLDWHALAAEITAAIRQVDPDTPIIINSLSWGSAEWFAALEPTGDARTIYSLHAYDPDIYVIQEEGETNIRYPDVVDDYGETITFDRAWLEENYRPVREFAQRHNVPIYVGEFGALRWVPDATAFLSDQMDLFETYGWNYAVYVWRGDEPDFDGFNLEYGPDPANHAAILDNPLLAIFRERWAHNADSPGSLAAPPPANEPSEDISSEDGESSMRRNFTLPLPLFAPDSAWNQSATDAAVLPDSDQQILVTFRVLLGDFSTLEGYDGPATTWPYADVNLDEFTVPIFRVGAGEQEVVICEDEGVLGWPHPKFGIET